MNILRKIKRRLNRMYNRYVHYSYSQCGEDLIVSYIFNQIGITNPSYLDLGAHHPIFLSNTYIFYKNGSRGVCVEPDLNLFKKIKRARKRDICLNMGVSKSKVETTVDFYLMSAKTLSTFSKQEALRLVETEGQKIESILKIPTISVNQIIEKNFKNCPNFISLDIEGLDFEVLEDFDFTRFQPEVFCIETITFTNNNNGKKLENIIKLMLENGYFVYADTYINTIFVNKKIWSNKYGKS